MKLTIEHDDGKVEVFENILDLYIAVHQEKLVAAPLKTIVPVESTRSFSWGSNVREIVKEVRQSLDELQDHLRGSRHGGSS